MPSWFILLLITIGALSIIIVLLLKSNNRNSKLLLEALAIVIFILVLYPKQTPINTNENFYNCLTVYYYVLEDLQKDIFTDMGDFKESDKLGKYIYKAEEKIEPLSKIMSEVSEKDSDIKIKDFSYLYEYFQKLGRYSYTNDHKLPIEQQNALKNIIIRSERINGYVISSKNYKKSFDPVEPIYRITDELNAIKEITEEAMNKLD